MKLNPYLMFDGNCAEAFAAYEQILHGKLLFKMTYGESPMGEGPHAGFKDKWMHATMQLADTTIMASDCPPGHYEQMKGCSISVGVNDVAEAERIYSELSKGGEVTMAIQETFWAQRFAMFRDRFGINWMINCEKRS